MESNININQKSTTTPPPSSVKEQSPPVNTEIKTVEVPVVSTTGTELAGFFSSWRNIFSGMSSDSFKYIVGFLLCGFIIGSIHRLGICSLPGMTQMYCNNFTIISLGIIVITVAIISYTREPPNDDMDLFNYWQIWVIVIMLLIILIVMIMYSLNFSLFGGLGSSSYTGMLGVSPYNRPLGMGGFF